MSTGGRVFPSVTGGGLARGTGAVVDAIARRRQEALQLRQIDNSERITSLNAITTLLPHLPRGTTLADLDPAAQKMFGDAMGIDPNDPIFQAAELNEVTVRSFVDQVTLNQLQGLSQEDLARNEVVRANQGLNPLQEEVDLARKQSTMLLEAAEFIFNNPDRKQDFIDRQQGLDPITLELPDGTTKSFDRGLAAQLYVTMLRDQKADDFRFESMNDATKQASIQQVIDQVALREVAIAAPAVVRAMATYDRALEAGDYSIIEAFRTNPGIPIGDKLAMEVLDEGLLFGQAFADRDLPESFLRLRNLAEFVKKMQEADPEELQKLVDELDPATFGTFTESFFFRIGAPRFRPVADEPGTRTRAEADAAAAVAAGRPQLERRDGSVALEPTVQEQINAVVEMLEGNQLSREDLVTRTSEEVVAQAEAQIEAGGPVEPVEPTGPVLREDQEAVVELEQRDLAELRRQFDQQMAIRETAAGNPAALSSLRSRIGRLENQIKIDSTALPFATEVIPGTPNIPIGGIDPANMPASARTATLQLNTLVRRRALAMRGPGSVAALEMAIKRQERRLRTILAQL